MAKGRKPGTALDVGMGQGRNAIWLAQQGGTSLASTPRKRAVALLGKLPVNWRCQVGDPTDGRFRLWGEPLGHDRPQLRGGGEHEPEGVVLSAPTQDVASSSLEA